MPLSPQRPLARAALVGALIATLGAAAPADAAAADASASPTAGASPSPSTGASAAPTAGASAAPTAPATPSASAPPTTPPAPPASTAPTPTPTGADVSYPQRSGPFPAHQAFGIVGVNWPNAGGANPFRTTDIDWALGSSGRAGTDRIQLYVLTAEPGASVAAQWPTSDVVGSRPIRTPYGTCTGGDSTACAYVYGYGLAAHDTTLVPHPAGFRWWLDVETGASWQPSTSAGQSANRAALEGMVAGLHAAGANHIGIYSTGLQWSSIAGAVPSTSPLNGLPEWLAIGPATATAARTACSTPSFTHGPLRMVQFVRGTVATGSDIDVLCR
ncbi:hypothetical protein [Curtobacterium ammoniigenes]|uniref:hypothetical protein n=1 Tax=Curtobacterium ammoniigenes TaxID=395387 RepID=UPI000833CEAD|nr:hypothetical protein [Curtobacterium ammoniigenes]